MREKINKWISEKEYGKAIEACINEIEKAVKASNEEVIFSYSIYLGIIYSYQKNYKKSKEIFDQFFNDLLLKHASEWPGNELIKTYTQCNETEKALKYNNAYLRHHTSNWQALQTRGMLLYKIREYKSAHLALTGAIKFGAKNGDVYFTMAMVKIELQELDMALAYLEKAYEAGKDNAIYEILKLIYDRKGSCEYLKCGENCCNNLIINGVNGQPISNPDDLNMLIQSDPKHKCWYKAKELKNGNWVFNCHNHGKNNACLDHANRPTPCKDYPSQPLILKKGCTYHFKLNEDLALFSSQKTYNVICDLLVAYGFLDEKELLQLINEGIDLKE